MASGFFHLEISGRTYQVAESLRKYNVSWEQYLEDLQKGPDGPENIHKVTGISMRAWFCVWKNEKVRVLLGKRAKNDSSPNLFEAFGGKCDPGETILEALIREFWEETKLKILIIRGQVAKLDVFCTPNSKRWIAQIHFLVSAKSMAEVSSSEGYDIIELDSDEHQDFIWADGEHGALGGLSLTKGSQSYFQSAVAMFREMC